MKFHIKGRIPGRTSSLEKARLDGSDGTWTPTPLPDGVVLWPDTAAAKWIEESVVRHPFTVGQLIPDGFEAYARVLHPASRGDDEPVRWSTVASWTGRTVHPLMRFERIAGLPDDPNAQPAWGRRPREGAGPLRELAALLARFTTRADACWIGLWDGFGGLDMIEELEAAPRVRIPHRAYILFHGPLDAVPAFGHSGLPWLPPNLWWPDDRAWCVATDIDLSSTYVGGTRECISALLRDGQLEAFPSRVEDRLDLAADQINPAISDGSGGSTPS